MSPGRALTGIVIALGLAVGSWPASAARPPLRPLSRPVLDAMAEPVQQQILRYQSEVDRLLAGPGPLATDAAETFGDLGGLYLLYGLLSSANDALENARALDSDDFRWPYLLAFTHQTEGRLQDAVAGYRAALALRPDFVPALVRLGKALVDMGRAAEAEPLLERALHQQPSAAAAQYELARIAQAAGDDTAAISAFARVLELQPQASAVRYPLAQSLRRLGRLEEARDELALYGTTQVFIPDPVIRRLRGLATGSAVHAVRGQRALDLGDADTAVAEFRRAKEADPENAPVRRALALSLRRLGELDAALAEYEIVLDLEPANPINHQDFALALSEHGRPEEAIVHFRRAIDLSPDYRQAHLGLGIALARLGRFSDALGELDRAIALDPIDPVPRFERAMTLVRLERDGEAREALEELLRSTPDHPSARLSLARILELSGELDAAREHLQAALDSGPPRQLTALLHLALGRLAERQGEPSVALGRYSAAIESDSELIPARMRRASVLAATGAMRDAALEYERVLAALPDAIPTRLACASAWILGGGETRATELLAEGLSRAPSAARLAGTLALVYGAASDDALRSPVRARELARQAFSALGDAWSAEILAITLAANGLFEEAVRAQERILAAREQQATPDELAAARERLSAYQRQQPLRAPWQRDPSVLPPAVLPLPTIDSD